MILLTGATGFTGTRVVEELLRRGDGFRCLVRSRQAVAELRRRGVEAVAGDVRDPAAWDRALAGCSGLLNLVSFNQEHVPLALEKAGEKGVERVLFIGTTAIFTTLDVASKRLRENAERAIFACDLDWTLLRPTMIYGAPGDRNIERLIRVVRRYPVHPILGRGTSLLQPVHVLDLARGIVDAWHSPAASRRAFNLSGGQALSYRELVEIVARAVGRRQRLFALPLPVAWLAAETCRLVPGLPDIRGEQVLRLNEDKDFSHREAFEAFGFTPMDFETGVRLEIAALDARAA